MNALFTEILNLSIVSSFLIVAVLILRLLLKKAPKGARYVLWAMVSVRLLVPFSFESKLSLIPNAQRFNENVETSTAYIPQATATAQPDTNSLSFFDILPYIWICGVAIMLLYMVISYIKICLSVRTSVRYKDNIYMCDNVSSPFVLGIFKPKIYLSSSMSKHDINLVISHEQTHIKHGDNFFKPLGFLLLSIHWFNPLCWLAYFLFVKDIELFCDESVTKTLSPTARKKYSYALLNFSQKKTVSLSCPLAFAENDVKTRVKSILSYKKPALYVIIISAVLCVVTMVLFMSSPVSAEKVEAPTDNTPQVQETVATASEETQPETEKETQVPTEKETEKSTEKPTEAAQEYYDYSYDYSGNYSQELYEVVPYYESEAYKKQFEYYTTIFGDSSQSFEPDPEPYVEVPSNITPYEGEIVWDPIGPNISNFN
ncbi:MAG: hypothetical protein IIX27_05500 [Ruminococcus sp.]|nr:hypothetical protein [Ruminococcus sp.]